MTNLQKYIVDSLFARGQVTRRGLTNALETLPEGSIDKFLDAFLTCEDTVLGIMLEDCNTSILQTAKVLRDVFSLDLREAKMIVDNTPCNLNDYTNGLSLSRLQEIVVEIVASGATAYIINNK